MAKHLDNALELAARAVAIASDPETAARATIGQEPYVQEKHRKIALAVLEAIRTPTPAMIDAGEAWQDHCGDCDSLFSEMISVAIHGRNCGPRDRNSGCK